MRMFGRCSRCVLPLGQGALLAGAIAAALLAANWNLIFHVSAYELGDHAAGSLAVRHAKSFQQIHGPYSRWGFRHPGPALFYVYAAGELVFYDALKLVPTPANAQVIANLLLSSFFVAAALTLFARASRSPAFLPLALIAGVLHFSLLGPGPFVSIWSADPPTVMFLCLLAAATSVAAGHARALSLLVLAGGFLVHTHAAQPIFVVPLGAFAYLSLLYGHARENAPRALRDWLLGAWRAFPRAHWIAAATLTLFLLPLVLDLAARGRSNLSMLLEHQRFYGHEHYTLTHALAYFLQFGTYLRHVGGSGDLAPEGVAAAWQSIRADIWIYIGWAAAWIVSLGWAVWHLRRPRTSPLPAADTATRDPLPRFVLCGCIVVLIAIGATLTWGVRQHGGMLYYLGLVNTSIYGFGGLLLVAVLASFIRRPAAGPVSGLAYAGLLVLCWFRAPAFAVGPPDPAGAAIHQTVTDALAGRSDAHAPRLLLFEHDAWPLAVGVALQLERAGVRVFVSPEWINMFGDRYSWTRRAQRRAAAETRIWSIRTGAAPKGAWPLAAPYHLATEMPVRPLDPSGAEIRFSKEGNFRDYMAFGWSDSDGDWTASVGYAGVLEFEAIPAARDVELILEVFPMLIPGKFNARRLRVSLNGEKLFSANVATEREFRAVIPAALWNKSPRGRLVCEFADAATPASLRISEDQRLLSFGFRRAAFRPVP